MSIYINTLFNKILLGRHSINTTTAITQLPIEGSKVDLILINGKAVVYEIKTELDTFDRLMYQLEDYYKAFPYVNVVTCSQQDYKLYQMLKDSMVILTNLIDSKNNSVIIPIHLNREGKIGITNEIPSMYGKYKGFIEKQIKNGNLLYWNKEKDLSAIIPVNGLQLSKMDAKTDPTNSVLWEVKIARGI